MNREDLTVGMPVKVFGQGRSSHDAKVTAIGRTLVTITSRYREGKFYIQDQSLKSPHGSVYFRTLPQIAEEQQRINLIARINDAGLEVARWGGQKFTIEQLTELVELVEGWKE